jgi:superfamily I DNA/RNA helicase/Zn-dependent peptidase ImmA (M78 family)
VTSYDRVRRLAWQVRRSLAYATDTLIAAKEVISALERLTGIGVCPVAAGDPILGGAQAVLDASLPAIYQNDDLPEAVKLFDAAHEYGHWFLHHHGSGSNKCECSVRDLNVELDELESLPEATVIGYSSRERRESEANTFAFEILLPLAAAKRAFEVERLTSDKIAVALGISASITTRQVTDAILLPLPKDEEIVEPTLPAPLDVSQWSAANAASGPLLVSAGPGTGKTKTLVGRCLYLTRERHVRPHAIAALTYSRKAAGEMVERLQAAGVGSGSDVPWVGTFHSFGNEILRKYGADIGLAPDFHLIDEMDAIILLENNLGKLQLNHLSSLHNPSQHLSGILRNIRRAKDELCGPEAYTKLAEEMGRRAKQALSELMEKPGKLLKKDTDRVAKLERNAARSLEVARCYGVYQDLLRESNLVDYSDLIVRTVELLERSPDTRVHLHRRYSHVLADEYQDVNRASARLLRLLVGSDADGLWVVGDHRQSIYQFQGASPANVSLFESEYPSGSLHRLSVNYRSTEEIVRTFSLAAGNLSFGQIGDTDAIWTAFRGSSTSIVPSAELALVNTSVEQFDCIHERIQQLTSSGIPLSRQAVLCRTHSQARQAASALTKLGTPTLYIGQLLERPEIKDLIAVIAATSNRQSAALARMCEMPEYAGRREIMDEHLTQLDHYIDRPSSLVRTYLFEISRFLELGAAQSIVGSNELLAKLAIRQFIDLIDGFDRRVVKPASDDAPNRCVQLFNYLRRVAGIGSAVNLPESDAVSEINAIKVMTIHSAKGLEFPAVYLPNLNEGKFPARSPHDGIPEVEGLSQVEVEQADEEECLFFVALSRARDNLLVTYYRYKDNGAPIGASPYLQSLSSAMSCGVMTFTDQSEERPDNSKVDQAIESIPAKPLPLYSLSELEIYLRCPRKYYFEKVAKVEGAVVDAGYLNYYGVIRDLVDWIETESDSGTLPLPADRMDKLTYLWQNRGLSGHIHEQLYWQEAQGIALADSPAPSGKARSVTMTAKLRNALVHVRPDKVAITDNKLSVVRRVVGEAQDDDHTDKRLAMFRKAATDSYPEMEVAVELHYLKDGNVKGVVETRYEPARLAKYEAAVDGIAAEEYPAKPQSSDHCISCSYLFVCPRKQEEN